VSLPNVFESNAAKLKELHDAIYAALKRRSESPACRAVWQEACRRFHSEYDSLAFPGGLDKAFSQLKAGDPTTIEMVVRFLEADPYFFFGRVIIKNISSSISAEIPYRTIRRSACGRSFWPGSEVATGENFAPIAALPESSRTPHSRIRSPRWPALRVGPSLATHKRSSII